MIRNLISRFNRSISERLVSSRRKFAAPMRVWFEPEINSPHNQEIAKNMAMPGETVERGQPIARVWAFDDPSRPPVDVLAERTGLLVGMRACAYVTKGDGFAFGGEPITREALLAETAGGPTGGGAEVAA